MLKLFARYATARNDKLEVNVDIPKIKYHFSIVVDDYYNNLAEIIYKIIPTKATLKCFDYSKDNLSDRIFELSVPVYQKDCIEDIKKYINLVEE